MFGITRTATAAAAIYAEEEEAAEDTVDASTSAFVLFELETRISVGFQPEEAKERSRSRRV